MALSSSPRKTVPLATGDEPRLREPMHPTVTKRVFYCGVVVEGSEHGRRLPDGVSTPQGCGPVNDIYCWAEIQDLVLSLGSPLESEEENMLSSNRPSSSSSSVSATRSNMLAAPKLPLSTSYFCCWARLPSYRPHASHH